MDYRMAQEQNGVFHFQLGPSFWGAARKKAEEIADKGGELELFEDMEPVWRTFAVRGDEDSVQEMLQHICKMTAH